MNIIIGVPGTWTSHKDLVERIAINSGGYLFAGRVLMNTTTNHAFELEVCDFDPDLLRAFAAAGRGSLTEDDLRDIGAHKRTCYLIGKGGSVDAAQRMMDAGCALLRAGGMGVKVESSGKAHSTRDWNALASDRSLKSLYQAYVTFVGGKRVIYSCGMHNLGMPDAAVDSVDAEEGTGLLQAFLLSLLLERPVLKTGHTFSCNAESPIYGLTLSNCEMYPADDPFFNPYGIWKLHMK